MRGIARPVCGRGSVAVHGFGDSIKQFLDDNAFEKWAPRSSRRWRLGQPPTQEELDAASAAWDGRESDSEDDAADPVADLEQRLSKMVSSQPEEPLVSADPLQSFEDATDAQLDAALSARLSSGATAATSAGRITAEEMRELIFNKYKKDLDMSFARRDIPGKTIVSLNVMWTHLGLRSFPLTEEEYMEKLDGIGYVLEALGSDALSDHVRQVLLSPPKSVGGLPARPVVGTAVAIQLPGVSQERAREFFRDGQ